MPIIQLHPVQFVESVVDRMDCLGGGYILCEEGADVLVEDANKQKIITYMTNRGFTRDTPSNSDSMNDFTNNKDVASFRPDKKASYAKPRPQTSAGRGTN